MNGPNQWKGFGPTAPISDENPSLNAAYKQLMDNNQLLHAQAAMRGTPIGDSRAKWFKTGRSARRAARRGHGLMKLERSRCQRSAEKRGVRKVWAGR